MLDLRTYARDWEQRRAAYVAAGLEDQLVTSDDLQGVTQQRIDLVVEGLVCFGPAGR